jgi:hypothetical protein
MAFRPGYQPKEKKPPQGEYGIQKLLAKFLDENNLENTAENKQVLRDGIEQNHDGYYTVESLLAVMRQNRSRLAHKVRTLPRIVTAEELQAMYQKVLEANPWIADTEKNGELIATAFLDDPNPKRDIRSMVAVIDRIKSQLDMQKPTPPPNPVYDESPLKTLSDGSWQLPLHASEWEMRSASKEQMRDLVERLRKFEAWRKEIGE